MNPFETLMKPYQYYKPLPKHSNPNLLPIGETFGFVVFLNGVK